MNNFDGLGVCLGNLSRLSNAQTRSISPENFTGEKGKAGMSTDGPAAECARDLGRGWKLSPFINIKAGETAELANIDGSGAIQQIWMTPTGHWRHSILASTGTTRPSRRSRCRSVTFSPVAGASMLR